MTELIAMLQDIRNNHTGLEYISRTKAAIADEMRALDPTMSLVDTLYFNHSAIPDFVIKWPNERAERNIYLRGSYASIIALDDVDNLTTGDPILLSLSAQQDFADPERTIRPGDIQSAASRAAHTLVTDAAAVAGIAELTTTSKSPMAALVRANFARGGRGLIDIEKANALISTDNITDSITEEIESSFFHDAIVRMQRTAQLITLSRADRFEEHVDALSSLTGILSRAEMEQIIPWLLMDPGTTRDRRFWSHIGKMMTFQDLESLHGLIGDTDLTPLITANVDRWFSTRGYLGFALSAGDELTDSHNEGKWGFRGGVVGFDIAGFRLHISSDGRALKGRTDIHLPIWSDLASALVGYRLREVSLRGIDRSIAITAEQSDNIATDVEAITQSVDDRYYVSELKINFRREDSDDATGTVQFGRGLIASNTRDLTLHEIFTLCTEILGYADPQLRQAAADIFSE